ncbi:MAG: hypothetical protein HYY20_08715 [Candidatus Tectomicrobia bacterium]|uniref:Multidrug resistance protein MdtA-like C-terminal permuted SH3 domain-containing protein n=1 Tax=Tectimicrobiota bacterium TaxID=2528274 RepID=A0A932CP55_UNCTE|nr:hypothetical protein [Candidatus Tectomicrobia bacterium]
MQVVLTLTMEPNVVVIPAQAIQLGRQGPYVFVLRIGATATELYLLAEPRPVVVARIIEDEAVIQRGLRPGEQVVTGGQAELFAGARVEIRSPESTVAEGAEIS